MDLYVEKYRPKTVEDYLGNPEVIDTIKSFIDKGSLQNLVLYGKAGGGKTSLAKILVNELNADSLYINASDERGIDTIRDKIIPFASSMGFADVKVIILDEADYLTPQAQATLRNTIETFSENCRFILTCNYLERIITPLQSRLLPLPIEAPDKKAIVQKLLDIAKLESIELGEDYKEDIGQVVLGYYPDIRKIINVFQQMTKDGTLQSAEIANTSFEKSVVEGVINGCSLVEIRQIIADSKARHFDSLFRTFYDRIEGFGTERMGMAILILAEYQYQYTFVVDKEITIVAMIQKLLEL